MVKTPIQEITEVCDICIGLRRQVRREQYAEENYLVKQNVKEMNLNPIQSLSKACKVPPVFSNTGHLVVWTDALQILL